MPNNADSLARLNTYLAALIRSGVSLDFGVTDVELLEALQRVSKAGGASEALEAAPVEYQRLVASWRSGADLTALLDNRLAAECVGAQRTRLRLQLAYPLVVALLALVGVVVMGRTVMPLVESAFADLRRPVGVGVAALQLVRSLAVLWAPLVIAGLVAGWWVLVRAGRQASKQGFGVGSRLRTGLARTARETAALLAGGVSREQALALSKADATRSPLLGWAKASAGRAEYAAIGKAYEAKARRSAERFARITPAVLCAVVGGGAMLLYALSLFLPVAELLWALGEERGHAGF